MGFIVFKPPAKEDAAYLGSIKPRAIHKARTYLND